MPSSVSSEFKELVGSADPQRVYKAKKLIRDGLSFECDDVQLSAITAVELKDSGMLEFLLRGGVSSDLKNDSGLSLLHISAMNADAVSVALLMRFKADHSAVNEKGMTPLMLSSQVGDKISVRLLIRANADSKLSDDDGDTALWYSVKHNNKSISRLLIKHGSCSSEISSDYPEVAAEFESKYLMGISNYKEGSANSDDSGFYSEPEAIGL